MCIYYDLMVLYHICVVTWNSIATDLMLQKHTVFTPNLINCVQKDIIN